MDIKKLVDKVIELAERYPLAKYNKVMYTSGEEYGCLYNRGVVTIDGGSCLETEGCLFGQALREIGERVPDNLLPIDRVIDYRVDYEVDHKLIGILTEVQTKQDHGYYWGEAIKGLKAYNEATRVEE